MTQLTTIVCLLDGRVLNVRAHMGFKDDALARMDTAGATMGLQIEFHPIILYSDTGDAPVVAEQTHVRLPWVRRYKLTKSGWLGY